MYHGGMEDGAMVHESVILPNFDRELCIFIFLPAYHGNWPVGVCWGEGTLYFGRSVRLIALQDLWTQ